ncbi:MAG: hypothetical protein ACFE9I_04570 [Candidatus Hermodarchaeota archaeon]
MRIKRFEFGISIILLAFFAMAGAVMLLSAYGAACVAWGGYDVMPYSMAFGYVADNLLLFQASNIITWIFGFVWGFVIYMYLTGKKWTYWAALATSAVGFIFGLIPALIADTKNFTEPFEGIGSPHWGRTLINLLILIILLVILVVPYTRHTVKNFITRERLGSKMATNIAKQLMFMSIFFFWLAFVSFLGTSFLADAHVVNGINFWETIEIQFIGGIVTTITGSLMLTSGLIINQIKQRSILTRTIS